jgi:HTH-type transcriptional repressor of NAD biosynthesis genes
VLTSDESPSVGDGLRDGEHLRAWMTQRLRERLRAPSIEVRGTVAERVEAVLSASRAG